MLNASYYRVADNRDWISEAAAEGSIINNRWRIVPKRLIRVESIAFSRDRLTIARNIWEREIVCKWEEEAFSKEEAISKAIPTDVLEARMAFDHFFEANHEEYVAELRPVRSNTK